MTNDTLARRRVRLVHHRFAAMGSSAADTLFDTLTGLVASSLTPGIDVDDSWAVDDWTARRDTIKAAAQVYLAIDTVSGNAVGFVAYQVEQLLGRPTIHLIAVCVRPDFQSSGLGYSMNARLLMRTLARSPFSGLYIAAHILNPGALDGWRKQVRDRRRVFPQIGDDVAPSEHLVLAACEFVERHDPDIAFDKRTGVLTAKHRPGPRSAATVAGAEVAEHFDRYVDRDAGDTVLLLIDASLGGLLSQATDIVRATPRAALVNLRSKAAR